MKRFYVSLSLLLLTALCLFSPALADEASFFDPSEGWVIRANTEGSGPYTVKIEVRDTGNNLVPPESLVGISGNPSTVAADALFPDISLSFDTQTGAAYLFYTTAAGLQLATYTISSGGPNINVAPLSWDYGSVNAGSTSDKTFTVSNTGTANLVLGTIAVTGTGFSKQSGTCTNGQTLAPAQNCTITVRFAPGAAGPFTGNLSVPSNDINVNVQLSGTGVSQGGNSDLIVTTVGLTNCCDNNKQFTVSITVKNQGAVAAGAFKVKGYMSPDSNINLPPAGPPTGDTLLFTWSLTGLAAGATASNQITASFNGYPIHKYYYLIFKVDADGEVGETNETNNLKLYEFALTR